MNQKIFLIRLWELIYSGPLHPPNQYMKRAGDPVIKRGSLDDGDAHRNQ